MHIHHLVGILPQDRGRLGRAAGLRLAVAGAGVLLGCGAVVAAVLCFQLLRSRNFRKRR